MNSAWNLISSHSILKAVPLSAIFKRWFRKQLCIEALIWHQDTVDLFIWQAGTFQSWDLQDSVKSTNERPEDVDKCNLDLYVNDVFSDDSSKRESLKAILNITWQCVFHVSTGAKTLSFQHQRPKTCHWVIYSKYFSGTLIKTYILFICLLERRCKQILINRLTKYLFEKHTEDNYTGTNIFCWKPS